MELQGYPEKTVYGLDRVSGKEDKQATRTSSLHGEARNGRVAGSQATPWKDRFRRRRRAVSLRLTAGGSLALAAPVVLRTLDMAAEAVTALPIALVMADGIAVFELL